MQMFVSPPAGAGAGANSEGAGAAELLSLNCTPVSKVLIAMAVMTFLQGSKV